MDTRVLPCAVPVRSAPSSLPLQTTLYDLIAALSADVGPDEDDVLTATVIHLLQTHRVMYTCGTARYRLVCDGAAYPTTQAPAQAFA